MCDTNKLNFTDYLLKYLIQTYRPKTALGLGAGKLNQSLEMAKEEI